MGDGGFWHNGLTTSVGNAVYNKQDGVILVVDNFYIRGDRRAGHPVVARRQSGAPTNNTIVKAVKGIGAKWVRQIDRTYDVGQDARHAARGAHHEGSGPKVIVASSECMLNKQRREKPLSRRRSRQASAWCAALRRRRGRLHRRPRLHPSLRLPVAVGQEDRRSAPRRSGGGDRRQLRRLRQLRRGRRRGGALPVLLPRRHHPQSDLVRSLRRRTAAP